MSAAVGFLAINLPPLNQSVTAFLDNPVYVPSFIHCTCPECVDADPEQTKQCRRLQRREGDGDHNEDPEAETDEDSKVTILAKFEDSGKNMSGNASRSEMSAESPGLGTGESEMCEVRRRILGEVVREADDTNNNADDNGQVDGDDQMPPLL